MGLGGHTAIGSIRIHSGSRELETLIHEIKVYTGGYVRMGVPSSMGKKRYAQGT